MRARCPFSRCLLRPVGGIMLMVAMLEICLTFYLFTDVLQPTSGLTKRSMELPNINLQNSSGSTPERMPHDVLILTYMRSGSSFLGKILAWRKDAFYWYEPLFKTHTWQYLSSGGKLCESKTGLCENSTTKTKRVVKRAMDFLLDIYNCRNLEDHYPDFTFALQGSQFYSGLLGKEYDDCVKNPPNCSCCFDSNKPSYICRSKTNGCRDCLLAPTRSKVCFDRMVENCDLAQHKVVKALRIDTSLALSLLQQHPSLKLLQVYRDPRAIINSRLYTKWYYDRNTTPLKDAKVLCDRMDRDLTFLERLQIMFPGRVKIGQYEDFSNQIRLAKGLYEFLGMAITEVEEKLFETLAEEDEAGREDFHPDNYRSTLDWNLTNSINKDCLSTLQRLGLRVFKNEDELRNKNISLFVGEIPFSFQDKV